MFSALILYVSGRTYSLTSALNNRFLRNFFIDRFIYSQTFCQKSAEWKSAKKYFSYFSFDDWAGIRTQAFASNKPTRYILDHSDFILFFAIYLRFQVSQPTNCADSTESVNILVLHCTSLSIILFKNCIGDNTKVLEHSNYFGRSVTIPILILFDLFILASKATLFYFMLEMICLG